MNNLLSMIDAITNEDSYYCDIKRENGNINGDTSMAIMLKYGSECSKEYVLKKVLPNSIADAHINGDIHIHDLDFYLLTTTCCQIDLGKLFTRGFNTGHGFLREPQSISTAAALTCIAIQSNQNDQHGGQSIPAFDYMLAPYVKKSYMKHYRHCRELSYLFTADDNDWTCEQLAWKMTEKETFQAMEAIIHNLNTMHSRAGAQVPFSSINYGTDTSKEGRLITSAILKATEEGMGNHETPIFPIQIFKCKKGINQDEGEPNYDLFREALHVSGLRMYPNFSFLDSSFNAPYLKEDSESKHIEPSTEVAYMGCRTRVLADRHGDDQTYGRGNLSFTTINLPRIGMMVARDAVDFAACLGTRMGQAIWQLMHRYSSLCDKKYKKSFPFLLGSGVWYESESLGEAQDIHDVLKHGTLAIGFIGLAECVKAMLGEYPHESDEAMDVALSIVKMMRELCDDFSSQYDMNVTLLATPAEGTAGRFIELDRALFGVIDGVNDREYYTNSFHVPVWHKCSIAKKIELEGPFHSLCNAGHITYVEVDGDASKNVDAMETIVKYAGEKDCGYFAINHPIDFDPVCGFTGIIGETCPKCGRKEGE